MNKAVQEVPAEEVVADYLANRMNEADAEAFELYCIEHPEFARYVERDLALKTGLRQLDESVAPVKGKPQSRTVRRWPLALAASVVLLLSAVAVVQYLKNRQPLLVAFTSMSDLPEPLRRAVFSHVRLARMRGNDAETHLSAPANGVFDIAVLTGLTSSSGTYSAEIFTNSAPSIKPLIIRGLRPNAEGFLEFFIPAAQLIGRSWMVSIRDDGDMAKLKVSEVFRLEVTALPEASRL